MCKATFVEFNIPRITFGLSLSFFHVCLLTVLAMVPKNVLLRRFIRYTIKLISFYIIL